MSAIPFNRPPRERRRGASVQSAGLQDRRKRAASNGIGSVLLLLLGGFEVLLVGVNQGLNGHTHVLRRPGPWGPGRESPANGW